MPGAVELDDVGALEKPTSVVGVEHAGAASTQRYGAGVLDPDDARRLLESTEVVELDGAGQAVS